MKFGRFCLQWKSTYQYTKILKTSPKGRHMDVYYTIWKRVGGDVHVWVHGLTWMCRNVCHKLYTGKWGWSKIQILNLTILLKLYLLLCLQLIPCDTLMAIFDIDPPRCAAITDVEGRSQTSYTAPCNGVVSHRAPFGVFRSLLTTHAERNSNKMCPWSSPTCLC